MATITEFRRQFPQYDDMSDQQLADALYAKHYSDMPREQFDQRFGFKPDASAPPTNAAPGSAEYAQWAVEQARAGKKLPQVSKVIEYKEPPPNTLMDKAFAASGSFIEGVPVAGPTLIDLAKQGRAAMQGMTPEDVTAQYDAAKAANPISSMIGGTAGAVLPLAAAGTLPGVGRVLGQTGGLLSQSLFGAGSSAAIGAADTLMRGGDVKDAITSGGISGAIGGAVPLVGRVLFGGGAPAAAKNIGKVLGDDGLTPSGIQTALQQGGADTMLMDLGPNLQQIAGRLAATPGRAQKVIRDAVKTRVLPAAKAARVANDVASTIGVGPDIKLLIDQTTAAQKAAARPLYQAIEQVPVNALAGEFALVFNTPMGRKALRDGIEMAANHGVRFSSNGLTGGMVDYAKRVLDDIARAASREGKDNIAGQAADLARRLRTEADKVIPGYQAARDAFAGPAAVKDAIEAGADAFSKDMTPQQLRRELSNMAAGERDGFLKGFQAWVEQQMGSAVNNSLSLRNMLRKGWNEQKLRIMLGDDIADDLLKRIDREVMQGETNTVVAGSSETARRELAGGMVEPTSKDLKQTTLTGFVIDALNKARNAISGAVRGGTNLKMAQALTSKAGVLDPAFIQQLGRASQPGRGVIAPAAVALGAGPDQKKRLELKVGY